LSQHFPYKKCPLNLTKNRLQIFPWKFKEKAFQQKISLYLPQKIPLFSHKKISLFFLKTLFFLKRVQIKQFLLSFLPSSFLSRFSLVSYQQGLMNTWWHRWRLVERRLWLEIRSWFVFRNQNGISVFFIHSGKWVSILLIWGCMGRVLGHFCKWCFFFRETQTF
jgi:hypothetical protein